MTAQLPPRPDWHTELLNESLRGENKSENAVPGVCGNFHDYVLLSGQGEKDVDPIESFNIFIRRWIHPDWWPHLMDDDDNEAEYVRRAIRGEEIV